ncbi:MAG TPA: Fe2+-dependent dioxygenase [Caulobacteraceae bacterium]
MLVKIPAVLSAAEAAAMRTRLEAGEWVDGRVTAGAQSALAKHNLQLPEDAPMAREFGARILDALGRNPAFISAALPLKVFPPLFNRYDIGMRFDDHVDNAIRFTLDGRRVRTDLSATLFLTDPDAHDGGELIISDTFGEHAVKLSAGDLVVYPGSSLHRVREVTRGARWAAFFWVQSMVRSDEHRALLHRLDADVAALRERLGDDDPQALSLTGAYHNLLRLWAEV